MRHLTASYTAQLRIVFSLVGILLLSACSGSPDASTTSMTRHTLQHAGLEREYFVFLPPAYANADSIPAVIFLHGYGGTATGTEAEVARGLNDFAEQHGYMMIYPQGTWFMSQGSSDEGSEITSWNHVSDGFDTGPAGPICTADRVAFECPPECGNCGQCGWTSCHDDVGFIRQLVATVDERFEIDHRNLSIAGFSNGAMMANRMACESSELFASVVLIGGRLEPGFECTPTQRLPLLQMNGVNDDVVPFDGRASGDGYFFASSASTSEHWTNGLTCDADASEWPIDEEGTQCSVRCGATQHESLDCVWAETDHRWPGTGDFFGSNGYCVSELQAASMPERAICSRPEADMTLSGSRLMFEFLQRHRRTLSGTPDSA